MQAHDMGHLEVEPRRRQLSRKTQAMVLAACHAQSMKLAVVSLALAVGWLLGAYQFWQSLRGHGDPPILLITWSLIAASALPVACGHIAYRRTGPSNRGQARAVALGALVLGYAEVQLSCTALIGLIGYAVYFRSC